MKTLENKSLTFWYELLILWFSSFPTFDCYVYIQFTFSSTVDVEFSYEWMERQSGYSFTLKKSVTKLMAKKLKKILLFFHLFDFKYIKIPKIREFILQ